MHNLNRAMLRQQHLFASLSEEQFERLCATATVHRHQAGHNLFFQGQPAASFFLVMSGQVKLSLLSRTGEEKIIDIIGPGRFFAEAVMFMESECYPVNASTLEDTELVGFDSHLFRSFVESSPKVALDMLASLSARMHFLLGEIDRLALHTATNRFICYLLEIATDENQISLTVPKQTIASRLSIKPETLSRILKQLKSEGVIAVDGGNITIKQRRDLLKQLAGLPPTDLL